MPIIDKLTDAFKKDKSTSSSSSAQDGPPANAGNKSQSFDHKKITVIYVLGGPGAGKGTESELLVKDYDFVHLSAGDLLRAEQNREGSEYGKMIAEYIKEGQVVPMEVTIKLLENAMHAALKERAESTHPGWTNGKGRFLIDGFPRKMDQALKFEEDVCVSSFTLFFDCPEEVLTQRLLERGKTSGRTDDNEESIKKRFVTFREQSMEAVEHYRKLGKLVVIDSSPPSADVHRVSRAAMDAAFAVVASRE